MTGNPKRSGLSLTEILIGIAILGIGVISLATLFPIGLLNVKRAVNDTRSAYLGRSALAEVRIRGLLTPPYGPLANVFNADPILANGEPSTVAPMSTIPLTGPGLPVVIDPLGILSVADPNVDNLDYPTIPARRLGYLVDSTGTPLNHGLPRYAGGGFLPIPATDLVRLANNTRLAQEIFSAPDDLVYMDDQRAVPLQTGGLNGPRYLTPTNGPTFQTGLVPGTNPTLLREARYSWFVIARKVSAAQRTSAASDGVSNDDDNGDGLINSMDIVDFDEWNDPGPDRGYGSYGPMFLGDRDINNNGIDDTLEDDRPIGPFAVSIAVFYNRDFTAGETTFQFVFPFGPDGAPGERNIDEDADGITDFDPQGRPDLDELLALNSDDAPLNVIRIPLGGLQQPPDIPRGGWLLDATYDATYDPALPLLSQNFALPRHGYWYRVSSYERGTDTNLGEVLQVTLDGEVKAFMRWVNNGAGGLDPNGVGTGVVMRGLVGVYEKEIP